MQILDWKKVPGWFDFDDLYQEAVDRAPPSGARFLEIGILFGRSTLFLAEAIARSKKKIAFDACDSFSFLRASAADHFAELCRVNPDDDPALSREILEAGRAGGHLGITSQIMMRCPDSPHVNIRVGLAQDFASLYPDASLDFVFVDALHTYEDTQSILLDYRPKIAPGGVFAGHDYHDLYPGLVQAVKEILPGAVRRRNSFYYQVD